MNTRIEFVGFPAIYDLFPEGPHPFHLEGSTLSDLIQELVAHPDSRVGEALLEGRTKVLDPTIQVMINRRFIPKEELTHRKIREGDQITFLRLLAGG